MDTLMSDSENYEQLLKAMGFSDENEIRQALAISNNDINEAVAILTNEKLPKMTSLINTTDNDIEMCDISNSSNQNSQLYNQNNNNNNSNSGTESFHSPNYLNSPENNPLEFPVDALYQLESSVFTDSWSIPYKKDEWLGRLLTSTIALLKEGIAEADSNCKRFLDRLIPEVYKKLLNSSPVARWNQEIQNGVYNMTCLCVELIAIRLNQNGVPDVLLNTLSLIFDRENEFHTKNMAKVFDKLSFAEKLGGSNNIFTNSTNDTYGWLMNLINFFGFYKGFSGIKTQLEGAKTINDFSSLLKPITMCCNYLNREIMITLYQESFFRIYEIIKKLDNEDFKDKNAGKVFDLFVAMKKLSNHLWPNELENLNNLHLDVVLNMLKYPHFNAKMNSLKEICKLIELSIAQKSTIKEETLIEWIISQRILSLAVEGNIDQSQYCDKIKTIVEFIGDRIRNEEIGELWNMQYNKPMSIVENLYNIIAIAATKFNSDQLDYLLAQINQTWLNPVFKLHDKLVILLRMIGREAKSLKVYTRILEALWELKNREKVPRQLLLLIYNEHLSVLTGCRLSRDNVKREYLKKCCDEIKNSPGTTLAIGSLRHIYDIVNSYQKVAIKSLKDVVTEILIPILKTICNSLTTYHKSSYEKSISLNRKLDPSLCIDDVFTHEEAITYHLNLLKFIIQEGNIYLSFNYAQELWDTLITNTKSCDWDKYVGFNLFFDCILDLNEDSRCDIFKKQILKLKPSQLTLRGYECFKLYFLKVNEYDNKIFNRSDDFYIDKLDLTGRNFLWDIILYANDDEIADLATKFLLEILYEKVSNRLKRDISQLHNRFIQECHEKLENCLVTLDNNPIGQLLWNAFRISYVSVNLTEFNSVEISPRSEKLKCIERLLMIAEKYIITVEENSLSTRTNLPHFITFKGEIFPLTSLLDNQRQPIELFVSSNESLGELRTRLANLLSSSTNSIQIYYNDKLLNLSNDTKLLHNLNIDGMTPINIKTATTYPLTPIKDSVPNFIISRTDVETEKNLPGVLMANSANAFELLYRLEDLDEPKIQNRVRNILKLVPTDPKLLESFDKITNKLTNQATASNSNNSSLLEASFNTSMSSRELTPKRNESFTSLDSKTFYSMSTDFSYFFNKELPLYRILYHLEALCSRIAPFASFDSGTIQSSELFQQDFLKANGLEILISLLKLDTPINSNDYEIRQNIYILNLQLLRLILFGSLYPVNPQTTPSNSQNGVNKRPSTEPISTCAKKTITPSMINTNPINNLSTCSQQSFLDSTLSGLTTDKLTHGNILYTLSVTQINDIIYQLLILIWSAAAGNVKLANYNQNVTSAPTISQQGNIKASNSPNKDTNESEMSSMHPNPNNLIKISKEVKFVVSDHRLSTSSNMSTSSVDSSTEQTILHSGICMKKTNISSKDIKIASKAIEMISCFVQNRKDCVQYMLNLPIFNECVIDVLTGSISSEIRTYMEKFLFKLSTIETTTIKCKEVLLSMIIKARLPLWVNSSFVRGSAQRLISQSSQYFNLRCSLLENLTSAEQAAYSIDINKMLNDEINWLNCFTPTKHLKDVDNTILSGHLLLMKSLLTADNVNKSELGNQIIPQLLQTYLFPSSFILNQLSSATSLQSLLSSEEIVMEPVCSLESSRIATYNLLVELSRNCISNFTAIIKQLIQFHHKSNEVLSTEWNHIPPVVPRSPIGFCGLKNGGATCYMNAVLQQLFMMPGIAEYLLSIEDDSDKDKSVFYQLQNVFAHLKESKLEYYTPDGFWKAIRIAGQEVNIREQQDAFDFFISLTDQIDEYLKKNSKKPIFKNIFEGTFANQFICKDCPHRYEREEAFYGLNLIIKAGNLQDSLAQFVKDELLEGDNAYNCEKCGEKRSAIKRTCIKKLPKYLCIQLKRFDYDWESNRSLKFDDYFEFPRRIDVQPYMVENITKRDLPSIEEGVQLGSNTMDVSYPSVQATSKAGSSKKQQNTQQQPIIYDLVGIIVHSGQANAGHYYSFIKAPQNDDLDVNDNKYSDPNEKWYKFNDTSVEEIHFNDSTLLEECFGGTFTSNSDNRGLPEERIRYWNGYMLIYKVENDINAYDKSDYSKQLKQAKNVTRKDCYHASKFTHDSLSELAELVSKGDEKGLFNTCLPPAIEQTVKSENLEFCKNKDTYNNEYFLFIYNMARLFKLIQPNDSNYENFAVECTHLGLKFAFNTLFKTGKKLRNDLTKWLDLFSDLFNSSKAASFAAIDFILEHEANSNFIKHFMLESPVTDIREATISIFESCLNGIFKCETQPINNKITSFITSILLLLDKAVIDSCKNSHEYFEFLFKYSNMSNECANHLISLNLFSKLMCFLLGSPASMKAEESTNRRWSSLQSKEFSIVHELIATLVLRCNLLAFKTCENSTQQLQELNNDLLPMPQEIQIYLYGALSNRYFKEIIHAFDEINHTNLTKTSEMINACCLCNETFSANLIYQILVHINNSSSNELKHTLSLLQNICLIEDPLQLKRLKLITDGYKSNDIIQNGLLNIVRQNQTSDAIKSYQCVKFIVSLANKNVPCKEYLLKTTSNWEWAVNWLKTKMVDSIGSTSYMSWNTKPQSNDDSETRTFQRTKSAQRTLDDATALLSKSNELDEL